MRQESGNIGKVYNYVIRRKFIEIKHPSFEKIWINIFKWKDRVSESKVKNDIGELGINTERQRAGIRQCMSTNTPSYMKKH